MANQYASKAKDEPVYTALAEITGQSASRIAFSDWWQGLGMQPIRKRDQSECYGWLKRVRPGSARWQ